MPTTRYLERYMTLCEMHKALYGLAIAENLDTVQSTPSQLLTRYEEYCHNGSGCSASTRVDQTEFDDNDVETLAVWCSRSSEAYNVGAWQTTLLLQSEEFRTAVADRIAAMDLPADHPACRTWAINMTTPPGPSTGIDA